MRWLILLLLAANALMAAWTQGWLGARPGGEQREPQRLAEQLRPETLQLLDAGRSQQLLKAPPICRQIGPLVDAAAVQAAEAALRELGLPEGQWRVEAREIPGLWAVATRPQPGAADIERVRKLLAKAELKVLAQQQLEGESGPSLLLGRHNSAGAIESEAAAMRQKSGLSALRVVQLRAPRAESWLRVGAWPADKLKARHAAWPSEPQACAAPQALPQQAASAASR